MSSPKFAIESGSTDTSSSSASSAPAPPPKQPTAVRLSEDLLYQVAEKMLFLKHTKNAHGQYEVDMRRENAYTSFMSVDRTMFRVFMAQFARIREIYFDGYSPDKLQIEMYRDREKTYSRCYRKDEQFYGPYLVTQAFVGALVDLRKLNLTTLHSFKHLTNKWTDADMKKQKIKPPSNSSNSPIQSFCKLFLNKEVSDAEASGVRFDLDEMFMYESHSMLESNFEELLSLNVRCVCVFCEEAKLFDCSAYLLNRSTTAPRTEQMYVTMLVNVGMDICILQQQQQQHWESMLNFILHKCTAIHELTFTVYYSDRSPNNAELCAHFEDMKDSFTNRIFPHLVNGSPEGRICVKLVLQCRLDNYEKIKEMAKTLFEKGQPMELDAEFLMVNNIKEYIAIEYQVYDKMGRAHKFLVQITGIVFLSVDEHH